MSLSVPTPCPGMKVVIVGAGFVGVTTAAVLADRGCQVTLIDIDQGRVDRLAAGEIPFSEPGLSKLWEWNKGQLDVWLAGTDEADEAMVQADLTLLCVPTPADKSGAQSIKALRSAARSWGEAQLAAGTQVWDWGALVIKSTIGPAVPGEIQELIRMATGQTLHQVASKTGWHVGHAPEFLAEGTAVHDTKNPSRFVLGWEGPVSGDLERVTESILRPDQTHRSLTGISASEAAMIKMSSNALLAVRLSAVQELAQICEREGVSWSHVAVGVGLDPRIGPHFLKAGAGWGGSCFPKDTRALISIARGHSPPTGTAVLEAAFWSNQNAIQWALRTMKKATLQTGAVPRVLWLGTAFKAGTSDVRDSPALSALSEYSRVLLECGGGGVIDVWDPEAPPVNGNWTNLQGDMKNGLVDYDVIVVATAWPQFSAILMTAGTIRDGNRRTVIDLRGDAVSVRIEGALKDVTLHAFGHPVRYW